MARYTCRVCSKDFKHSSSLRNHKKTHLPPLRCILCSKTYVRRADLTNHLKKNHQLGPNQASDASQGATRGPIQVGPTPPVEDLMMQVAEPEPLATIGSQQINQAPGTPQSYIGETPGACTEWGLVGDMMPTTTADEQPELQVPGPSSDDPLADLVSQLRQGMDPGTPESPYDNTKDDLGVPCVPHWHPEVSSPLIGATLRMEDIGAGSLVDWINNTDIYPILDQYTEATGDTIIPPPPTPAPETTPSEATEITPSCSTPTEDVDQDLLEIFPRHLIVPYNKLF